MTDQIPTDAPEVLDESALVHAVDALTDGFTQVASELQKLTRTYERDRRFRRVVTGALILSTMAGMAIGGIAISTSFELRSQVNAYRLEPCLRGNVLRQDIYVAVDAVLDSIAPAADDEGRDALVKAKAAVRREIPLRDCG